MSNVCKNISSLLMCLIGVLSSSNIILAGEELVLYSARTEHLLKPLVQAFEKDYPEIKVKYITDKAPALLERLKAEGKRSPADLLMTVDAGNLWIASQNELLEAIDSKILSSKLANYLKDENNEWFALSIRARTLVYNPSKVKEAELTGYAGLADKKWKARLCLRTSKKVYNQSLVAMLIEQFGEKRTEEIVRSWVANLAAPVFANDTAVIEAVASGQCDVGLVNSYYFAELVEKNPKLSAKLYFPNRQQGGTHVNISGAGILRSSKNKKAAQKFLEWMLSDKAQQMIADLNYEFPAVESTSKTLLLESWGDFDRSTMPLIKAGERQAQAVRLMDRVGYK